MKTCRFILFAASMASTAVALAQQPASPAPAAVPQQQQLTSEQRAQIVRQDAEMSKAAGLVIQLVDQNKGGEVWDGASSVAKGVVAKDRFVQQISADRQKLGAPVTRSQVAVTRAVYAAGKQVPAGNYINVVFATKFTNAPEAVRELVSFRLDEDKTWRLSGYSLR